MMILGLVQDCGDDVTHLIYKGVDSPYININPVQQ